MMARAIRPILGWLGIALAATFFWTTTVRAAAASSYESQDCFFSLENSARRLECGMLSVPARRDVPESAPYRLAVVTMKSPEKRKGSPVLFINGGPGSPSIGSPEFASALWSGFLSELDWLKGRDLIIFDPRGVGVSEPAISCPKARLELHIDDTPKRARKILRKCWSRLRDDGLDLASFNTKEAVRDIMDLRNALGIESWVVWGVSYGTRVTLKLLEQDPQGIESAILMGVYPPGVDSMMASTVAFSEALEKVFEACELDPDCANAYPDLRGTFAALIEKRRAWPKAISALLTRTGWRQNHRFELDDALILGIVHGALYDSSAIAELPGFIAELAEGRFKRTRFILDMVDFNTFGPHAGLEARIVYYCNDVSPNAYDDRDEARARFPLFDSWIKGAQRREFCYSADLGTASSFLAGDFDPADRPVLILNGDFDPVTPSKWAARVAEKLPRSFFFRFAGNGHDTHFNDCAKSIIERFLANPDQKPSGSCLEEQPLPEFQIAGNGARGS